MTFLSNHSSQGLQTGQHGRVAAPTTGKVDEISLTNYRLRLAANPADLRAAQLLRFVVFNLELQEGLEQSYATCLDADAYDDVCDHLLVEDLRTGEVIGTYRLQTGVRAASNLGYY